MNRLVYCVVVAALCLTGSSYAAHDKSAAHEKHIQPVPEKIDAARMVKVLADPVLREEAIKAGQKAAFFCESCHGENGIGHMDYIPNLAQQNPIYMFTQLQKFGDGRRKDDFKTSMMKMIKSEDLFNIVIYYSSLPLPPTPPRDMHRSEIGRQHFLHTCFGCHGKQAKGTNDVPRLAGQHITYLTRTMREYYGTKATRKDARMGSISQPLTDPEIADLAVYIAGMP